jgi:hypothetical protein
VRRATGVLACAVLASGSPAAPAAGARVAGVVYDSLAAAPLAGAHVQVVPTDPTLDAVGRRTTRSDAEGRYAIEDVPPGRYVVGFLHPKLDSLGVDAPVRRVDLRVARDATVDLAVPSAASVISAWCGAGAAQDSSGVVLGFVREVASASTLADVTVAAQWSAITISARGARAGVQESSARTDHAGWFGLCGVPRGALLVLRAAAGPDSSALLELDVPDHGVLLRDIAMSRTGDAGGHPAPILRGTVRDLSGQPLPGARVRLWGTAAEARADDAGEFRFAASAAGTQLIDARMIGFVPLRRVVDVSPDEGATVHLVMTDFPMEIDTVRVLARRPASLTALAGFERRRRLGHGTFLDAEAVERRRPLVFTDLMRGIAGVELYTVDMMTRTIRMRATNGNHSCVPELVVDGIRLPLEGLNVDDVVPAELVKAIEVYPRRIQAPPEFQAADCGSVVVWTGLRGWLARRLGGPRG